MWEGFDIFADILKISWKDSWAPKEAMQKNVFIRSEPYLRAVRSDEVQKISISSYLDACPYLFIAYAEFSF